MKLSLSKKQHGGTMLGLIIGALIGLGAALAVAVYVTKVPVPFVNKNQPKGADTDAAEAKKNKDWNPNVPLAGKTPAKPAPAASAASAAVGVTPPPVVTSGPSAPATTTASVATGKPKVSADPLGDLAKAKSDSKPDAKPEAKPETKLEASSNSGADPFNYFVQVGAFRTPEDAEQQRAKLLLMGFQAKVTEREQSGRTVYRVRLGPFDKKDEADRNKEKLEGNGVETALVRVQR
jgi:cell division protein FtsN